MAFLKCHTLPGSATSFFLDFLIMMMMMMMMLERVHFENMTTVFMNGFGEIL